MNAPAQDQRRKLSGPFRDPRATSERDAWIVVAKQGAIVRTYRGETEEAARRLAGLRPRPS